MSERNEQKTIEWKRYWALPDSEYHLNNGLLSEPDGFYQPNIYFLEHFKEVPCLILIGEPGIGKTQTLEIEERNIGNGEIIKKDLRIVSNRSDFTDTIFNSEFIEHVNSTPKTTLVLDSLDESTIDPATLVTLLESHLKKVHSSRLNLRIVCRAVRIPKTLRSILEDIWGSDNVKQLELLPLTHQNILDATSTHHIDSHQFLEEVYNKNITSLASIPISLFQLINIYKQDGNLPKSIYEIFKKGCELLASETNPRRQDSHAAKLDVEKRIVILGRIATHLTLCKKTGIHLGQNMDCPDEYINKSQLKYDKENIDGREFEIEDTDLKECVDTALMHSCGNDAYNFRQTNFREFLCANYLSLSKLSENQIQSLLFHNNGPSDKKVVPELSQVTAFLAVKNDKLFEDLLKHDPQHIQMGDPSLLNDSNKKRLIDTLINHFESGKATDFDLHLRRFCQHLNHKELKEQLEEVIRNKHFGVYSRRFALEVAKACKIEQLQDLILEKALDNNEELSLRISATRALKNLLQGEKTKLLKPLLYLKQEDDPDDEIRGAALKALWPEHIGITEVLDASLTRHNKSFYGSFWGFFLKLPTQLEYSDTLAVLNWISDNTSNIEHNYDMERTARSIFQTSCEHLDKDETIPAIAKAAWPLVKHRQSIIQKDTNREELSLLGETKYRRKLLLLILGQMEQPEKEIFALLWGPDQIAQSEDFDYILRTFETEKNPKIKKGLAHLTNAILTNHTTKEQLGNRASDVLENNDPILKEATSWLREVIKLDSKRATQLKNEYEQQKKYMEEGAEERRGKLTVHETMKRIEELPPNQLQSFDNAVQLLYNESAGTHDNEYVGKPQLLPIWEKLGIICQTKINQLAHNYLIHNDDVKKRESLVAIALSLTLTKNENLEGFKWNLWAENLIDNMYLLLNLLGIQRNVLNSALLYAPDVSIPAIKTQLNKEFKEHSYLFSLFRLPEPINTELQSHALKIARTSKGRKEDTVHILEVLFREKNSDAIQYALSEFALPNEPNTSEWQYMLELGKALTYHVADRAWPSVWKTIQKKPSFGKDMIRTLSNSSATAKESFLTQLTEDEMANLYIIAEKLLPSKPKKKTRRISHPPDESILKPRILAAIKSRGTQQSIKALEKIKKSIPENKFYDFHIVEARRKFASVSWKAFQPEELKELFRTSDSLLIRSADELFVAVQECLKEYQRVLDGTDSPRHNYWDKQRRPNELKADLWTPVDENRFSSNIARMLECSLTRKHVFIAREVEVRLSPVA